MLLHLMTKMKLFLHTCNHTDKIFKNLQKQRRTSDNFLLPYFEIALE